MNENYYVHSSVQAVRNLHSELVELDYGHISIKDCLYQQAVRVHDAHQEGNEAVTFHLGSWCSATIGADAGSIMRHKFTFEQILHTIACEYGFADWAAVQALNESVHHVEFEVAVDAVVTGNLDVLQAQLTESPELTLQRSQYGHRASLLHYLGANGVESHRQITPYNAMAISKCLLDAGADINSQANMYGGSRVLELVLTSAHPNNAGVAEPLATLLKEHGAV